MQNLEQRRKPSRGFVALARGELRHFSLRNCRKKQECEPGAATDVSSLLAAKEPGCTGNGEDKERCDAPAAIKSARSPRPRQNNQRRSHGDEEKDVFQVHCVDFGKRRGSVIERWTLNVKV